MPEFAKWVHHHRYDGGQLEPERRALRHFYRDLLALCQDDAVRSFGYWGLRSHNQPGTFPDCPHGLYTFARFRPYSRRLLLVAANFQAGSSVWDRVRLTRELAAAAGLSTGSDLSIRLILDETGARQQVVAQLSCDSLIEAGFEIAIAV